MSDDFPECDFFCLRAGRVSVFPSNCGTADLFESIARDCSCAESPVAKGATCLQRFCAPADFAALEAAEETRCPGLVPGGAAAGGLSRRAVPSLGEGAAVLGNSTSDGMHGGCGGAVASPVVFVPLALVVFGVVAVVGAYRRRRCAEARISLGSEGEEVEDVEDMRVKVGEKGWSTGA